MLRIVGVCGVKEPDGRVCQGGYKAIGQEMLSSFASFHISCCPKEVLDDEMLGGEDVRGVRWVDDGSTSRCGGSLPPHQHVVTWKGGRFTGSLVGEPDVDFVIRADMIEQQGSRPWGPTRVDAPFEAERADPGENGVASPYRGIDIHTYKFKVQV